MINPHDIGQKGEVGEIHDGRPDKDHEAELRKAGQERHQAHDPHAREAHEKEGKEHETGSIE